MSEVLVRSVATGRDRLTVLWLRDRRGCAGLVDDRLTGLSGFRALPIFPRTGSVVIWMEPADLDVAVLVHAPRSPAHLRPRQGHSVRPRLLHRRDRPARCRRCRACSRALLHAAPLEERRVT
ncbi:hypothetical protein [Streptomyces sp. NPDC048295]|uniref:hypothetical protein n=1 Tax=Streptomyces sp. NPDC048295 TaxID=3154617 RepID=UPI0034178446